jgi:hypothetical protein
MSHAYYSLYCKQSELQQPWEGPWACGFASLVTCFRILGDRTTESKELIERFRSFGGVPHEGMSTDEAEELAQAFGYKAIRNPSSTQRCKEEFLVWMRKQWSKNHPVMLSVDSGNEQDEADHWWVVYGDPDQTNAWVMDPLNEDVPFQCCSVTEILAFAACNDGEGYIEYDGLAVDSLPESGLTGIPPSAALMGFLNANAKYSTGWTSQAIAAALVDNHFSSIAGVGSPRRSRNNRSISVSILLENKGPVNAVIDDWDVFFGSRERSNLDKLRTILFDISLHQDTKAFVSEADFLVREIALNLILIGGKLMDA